MLSACIWKSCLHLSSLFPWLASTREQGGWKSLSDLKLVWGVYIWAQILNYWFFFLQYLTFSLMCLWWIVSWCVSPCWFSGGGQGNGRNVRPHVAQQARRRELYFASRQWDLMSRHWMSWSASTCLNQRPICHATEISCAHLTGQWATGLR